MGIEIHFSVWYNPIVNKDGGVCGAFFDAL